MPPESLPPLLRQDQCIRVRRLGHPEDEWCYGQVGIVSKNGKSAVIDLLGGMVRTKKYGLIGTVLPLFIEEGVELVTGLDGTEYEVEVQ